MNVAFFGTSDRSIPILNSLKNNFNLKLCITKEDTLVGRKQEKRETAVKMWAKENGIDYYCISSIKNEVNEIISLLKKHDVGIGVVADFSFILPKKIIDTPQYGLINIHFSLLPLLRGASPVQHAILEGYSKTGITYYLIDEKMDTGDILFQIEYELSGQETSEELYTTLFYIAAKELPHVINDYIEHNISPKSQDHDKATYTYSKTAPHKTFIMKEDARIDWTTGAEKIERMIRAYYPWPVAWTYLGELESNTILSEQIILKENTEKDKKVKIYSASLLGADKSTKDITGTDISRDSPIKPILLKINELQIEGKNIIDWNSFKNGYQRI